MTAAQVRETIQGVVEGHVQYNTWYSSWNDVKDLPTEREDRFVVWDQWTARAVPGEGVMDEFLYPQHLVRLFFLSPASSSRTPAQRDALVEDAHRAAMDVVLKLRADFKDLFSLLNVVITTQFDEGVALDTGVLLQFTARSEAGVCLDESRFPPIIRISNTGAEEFDGDYRLIGTSDDHEVFERTANGHTYELFWVADAWVLQRDDMETQYFGNDAEQPEDATWFSFGAPEPPPTLERV